MVVNVPTDGQEPVTAVLCSGGLDSAVLIAHEALRANVQPVYINVGFTWEPQERAVLTRLLEAPLFNSRLRPLIVLEAPVADLYPKTHWALRGTPPTYNTPDSDVDLTGRNLLLLSKVGIYCALQHIEQISVGPLAGNPFPDATAEFFKAASRTLSLGLDQRINIVAPFIGFRKVEVINLGAALGVPWELTLSCMNPEESRHCGRCGKCRERLQAFDAAGLSDPASYVFRPTNLTIGQ